jgi:hypothetical protein
MHAIRNLTAAERAEVRAHCLQPGCPVGVSGLLAIDWPCFDFSGRPHQGVLHVAAELAFEILEILKVISELGYPIHSMIPIQAFAGCDERSMAANNSSCFNGRRVRGTERWSWHAYGRAIDLNPVQNPWKDGLDILPHAGRPFMNRSLRHPGVLRRDEPVVQAFLNRGWTWGGDWMEVGPDYHHFQKPLGGGAP